MKIGKSPTGKGADETRPPHPSHRNWRDFRSSMSWRMFRVMAEFTEGWEFIADFPKSVTIFGSTRSKEGDKWYEAARSLGAALASEGIAVVTGGGPGIMEAANRGASEAKSDRPAGTGESVGLNIELPREQALNPYVKHSHSFHYFFTRKLMLTYAAEAYVYFPGGYGTLDEFFEIVTLVQTEEINGDIPVILFGSEYWQPLASWLEKEVLGKYSAIDPEDLRIFRLVDSVEEAMEIIRRAPMREEFYDQAHYFPNGK
jgi:uncharacterized protein (TIGR00730 family)